MTTDLKTTLTANEQAAACVLLQACLDGMGGSVPADLHNDEYIWTTADSLVAAGWTTHEAAGTYGALLAKGIVQSWGNDGDVLEAWEAVGEQLWADWKAAGDVKEAIDSQISVVIDEQPTPGIESAMDDEAAKFIAALIKAGADEEAAKNMGNPMPGIICSTLRAYAMTWTNTRAAFIKTAQLAGFNRFTAQTQWQRARGK